MPHESSAVADLVRLAHREPIRSSSPQPSGPGDPTGKGGFWSGPWLVVIGLLVVGASVAGGYFMANQGVEDEIASPEAVALASEETGPTASEDLAALFPDDDAEEEIEPELEQPAEIDMELAKETGFDVLVTPSGAKVSLDGQFIGAAPLRVRNLLPGHHAIDIEGPESYFGRHLEFDLEGGEAEVLTIQLDSLGPDAKAESDAKVIADRESSGKQEADSKEEMRSGEDEPPPDSSRVKERGKKERRKGRRRLKASADEEKILDKAEQIALGTLMLGAKPPCDIVINGKKTGLVTPQRAIQLPAGVHRVLLVNEKHKIRKSFRVRIKSGRTTRAIKDLSSKM